MEQTRTSVFSVNRLVSRRILRSEVLSGVSSLSDYFFLSILTNKIVQNSLKRTGKITNYIWLTTKPWSFLKSLHNVKIIRPLTANCKLQLKTGSTYSLVYYYSSVTAFVKPILPMVKNHMMNSSNIFRTITPWKIKILFRLEGIKGRCWWYRILVAWKTFQSLSQNHQPELLDWQSQREDRERREEETLNINRSEITNLSPFTHHTTQAGDDLYLNIISTTYFIPPLHGLAVCGIILLNVEENEIHLRRQLGGGGENEGDGGENHHEEREEGVGLHYPCKVSPGGSENCLSPEQPAMSPGTRSGSTNMFSAGRRWFVQNPHLSVFLHTFVDTNFQIQFPLKVQNSINILLLVVGCGELIF